MSDVASTLQQLQAFGLLARVTSLKVGDVELQMLPAIARPEMSDERLENVQKALHDEIMFGSS